MSSRPLSASGHIEDLYVSHHGWLVSWLRARLGSTDQAADLAHDVFVRILQKVEWQAPHEPRAYLTVIAKGLVINFYQRQAIERAYLDGLRYAEIAQRTGLSLRTVNRYMVTAFERCLLVMTQDP